MATWSVSASTPAETRAAQMWARKAFVEAKTNSAWASLMGEGPNNIIQLDTRLTKEKGDAVNVSLVTHISGAGIGNDSTLEGNEVAPSDYSDSVLLFQIRQAIRLAGKMSEQRAHFDLRMHMKDELAYWYTRWFDSLIFKKLSGITVTDANSATLGEAGTTNSNIIYGGSATSTATLTTSDTLTLDLISKAKVAAKTGVFGSNTIYKMRPYVVGGRPYYVLWVHPYALYDLRQTTEWQQAVREAQIRGNENQLFSGATGIWDGVIIKEHDLVQTATDGGAGGNVHYAKNLFLGLQAGYLCFAQEAPNWVEKTFDFGNQYAVGTGMLLGFDKLRWNSIDFSVIQIQTAAKNPIL